MTKFDLKFVKSGYRHVDIFPEHIGNIWDLVGLLKTAYKDISTLTYYRLGCLLPHIYYQIIAPPCKLWRSKGFHSLVYLDDGFGIE
jgi:hypothetical protein